MTPIPERPVAVPRPVLGDPRAVPVIGTDAQLPPLPAQRLTPGFLRERLAQAEGRPPHLPGDGVWVGWGADRDPTSAGVLVPLRQDPAGLQVLLTRRTEHLRHHAGQISFPGGRSEPGDADAVATALREAQEEIGLDPALSEILGRMPVYTTVTRFQVTPVVALLPDALNLRPDPAEVAEVFQVPLAFLMNPAHHRRHHVTVEGQVRRFLSMPWSAPDGREYFIWGATAAMLRNLYHLLAD